LLEGRRLLVRDRRQKRALLPLDLGCSRIAAKLLDQPREATGKRSR
jgi:hypothetical protein